MSKFSEKCNINKMIIKIDNDKKTNINSKLSFGICSILNKDEEKTFNMIVNCLPNHHTSPPIIEEKKKNSIFLSTSTIPEISLQNSLLNYVKTRNIYKNEKRIGHPYKSRAPAIHKKPRTAFTKEQIFMLENKFNSQKYLASSERFELSKRLGISESQVKTWFQNRRTKWRRLEAEEREFEDKNIKKMSFTQLFFN